LSSRHDDYGGAQEHSGYDDDGNRGTYGAVRARTRIIDVHEWPVVNDDLISDNAQRLTDACFNLSRVHRLVLL
jgi:hypothetical protein